MSPPEPKPYGTPPTEPKIRLSPFTAHQPQADLDRLSRRLNDIEDIRTTYENSFAPDEYEFGVRKSWIEGMLYDWREFDWRQTEAEINSFPNFLVPLETRGHVCTVHFAALFSKNKDAVPVVFTHGWPGSFIEFLPMLQLLKDAYTEDTLPIHAIVPSMMGYAYSAPPPRHDKWSNLDTATLWDALMKNLGFDAYIAQGGDIGSHVTRLLGLKFDACKAIHLNFFPLPHGTRVSAEGLDEFDHVCVERLKYFEANEFAYRHEHATKPATIGMVVESSPIALLAWIGEKMVRWSDTPPSSHHMLSNITLYYLTKCFSTGLYSYWNSTFAAHPDFASQPALLLLHDRGTPVGYSQFPKEICPVPISRVKREVNLVWSRRHEHGGHFAALERPNDLLEDVLAFVNVAWGRKPE